MLLKSEIRHLSIYVCFFLALFLRFWKLNETMPIIGDFGWYYLQAKDILTQGYLPLTGIPSSVPVLHQGVLWTYLLSGAFFLGKFHPLSGGILSSLFGFTGVILTYYYGSKLFSRRIALLASLLAATFPFIVLHDRQPFQTSVIFPLTVIFAYQIFRTYKKQISKNFFSLGLCWGILFQLELAAVFLIPVFLIVYLIKEVKLDIKNTLSIAGGTFWGTLPFFLSDFSNGVFMQTLGFAAWFSQKLYENYYLIFGLLLMVMFRNFILRLKSIDFNKLSVLIWALIGILAIAARGVFSEAYFPLIYFPFLIISGTIFGYLIREYKYFGLTLFVLALGVSTFLSLRQIGNLEENGLANQIKAVDYIIKEANPKKVTFNYFGPGTQFHTGGNEWEYLFWWEGKDYSKQLEANYAIIVYPYSEIKGYSVIQEFGSYKIAVKND